MKSSLHFVVEGGGRLSIERGRLKIIFQTTFDITGDMRILLGDLT